MNKKQQLFDEIANCPGQKILLNILVANYVKKHNCSRQSAYQLVRFACLKQELLAVQDGRNTYIMLNK